MLKPAAPGTGVIAGGAARAILEEAGIHDVLAKSLGSSNHINVALATIAGLKSLKRPDEVAKLRGLDPEEFVPKGLLERVPRDRSAARSSSAPTRTSDGTAEGHPDQVGHLPEAEAPRHAPRARPAAASASRTPCPTVPRSEG